MDSDSGSVGGGELPEDMCDNTRVSETLDGHRVSGQPLTFDNVPDSDGSGGSGGNVDERGEREGSEQEEDSEAPPPDNADDNSDEWDEWERGRNAQGGGEYIFGDDDGEDNDGGRSGGGEDGLDDMEQGYAESVEGEHLRGQGRPESYIDTVSAADDRQQQPGTVGTLTGESTGSSDGATGNNPESSSSGDPNPRSPLRPSKLSAGAGVSSDGGARQSRRIPASADVSRMHSIDA